MRQRLLSLRGFDQRGLLVTADVVDGDAVEGLIAAQFAHHDVAFIHAHDAKPGCYAARIDRTR